MSALSTRLITKYPDVHPSDGYSLSQLDEAMRWHLQGTSVNPSAPGARAAPAPSLGGHTAPASAAPSGQQVPIKSEDVTRLMDLLSRLGTTSAPRATQPAAGAAPVGTAGLARPAFPQSTVGCHYCNDPTHGIGNCPAVEEDIRAGKCRHNHEGKVVLPGGAFVPRIIAGTCMRDRIEKWHHQNPNQTVRGTLSYASPDGTLASLPDPALGALYFGAGEDEDNDQ